jgi:FtsP/CotA-like multicopper oxidase with cupredoxin domain
VPRGSPRWPGPLVSAGSGCGTRCTCTGTSSGSSAPAPIPAFAPLKHTVSLPPMGGTAQLEFLVDNPGRWFFHCHNLYDLEAGMAREWIYTA